MNATAEKFGYPKTTVAEFEHWAVLLRPAQVTLGSLVLVCRDAATSFGSISPEASRELQRVAAAIDAALGAAFQHDKINYLMLMMVDPDVHFHVLPRYAAARTFAGASFEDRAWPGPPDVTQALELAVDVQDQLLQELRTRFAAS
ncbi:MAG: HIT family protein [Proteobacteria bacterium]|nr:HIT family protein [Pseudomonadota bacterium]